MRALIQGEHSFKLTNPHHMHNATEKQQSTLNFIIMMLFAHAFLKTLILFYCSLRSLN